MSDQLEPCPFCQSQVEWGYEAANWIVCYACGFTYGTDAGMKSIVKFWNRRVYPDWVHVLAETLHESLCGRSGRKLIEKANGALAAYRKATGKEEQ